jgi:hypothetical protein
MAMTSGPGPGEQGTAQDQPETSESGWDLEIGSIDDIGEGDEDLVSGMGEPSLDPGPASLGQSNDPIENYIDDFPGEEAA